MRQEAFPLDLAVKRLEASLATYIIYHGCKKRQVTGSRTGLVEVACSHAYQ